MHTPSRRSATSHASVAGDDYFDVAVAKGFGRSPRGLRTYVDYLFRDVPIAERRVLDIGAGTGLLGFFCLRRGAISVTSIEPEAAGADIELEHKYHELANALAVSNHVTLSTETFQEVDVPAASFDLVLLHNSINHLDEQACISLLASEEARTRYERIFEKLFSLCSPGAHVLITDASRANLFAHLRLPNPFARSIEWHKHQSPTTWRRLLEGAGFRDIRIRYNSFGRLGRPGHWLLANRFAAYVLHSQFIVSAHRLRGS